MPRSIQSHSAEPFEIRCWPSGRKDGAYQKDSPHHGLVTIVITSGPGKGSGVRVNFQAALDFARALRDPNYALRSNANSVLRVYHLTNGVTVERGSMGESLRWWSMNCEPSHDEAVILANRDKMQAELGRLADAITISAHQAEQDIPSVAQQVAQDHAALARGGFPLGLTHDKRVLDEAKKIHDNDPKLRRYAPSSRMVQPVGLTATAALDLPMPSVAMGPANPSVALRVQTQTMSREEKTSLLRYLEQQIGGVK